MAIRTPTPTYGPLRFVDEPPQVSTRTGMLIFSIASGGEEQHFALTSHAAQAMMEAARRQIIDLTEEQRHVLPFGTPGRAVPRQRNGRAE